MEYYYYCDKCGWDEGSEQPNKIFLVEKGMNDPNPETLHCSVCNKESSVKRWFNEAPPLIMPNQQYAFESKFKSFAEKQREGRNARGHVPIAQLAREADLSYFTAKTDAKTGEKVLVKNFINDTTVPTDQWNSLSKEKRKLAEKLGILSQSHYQSPGQVTPKNHHKLSETSKKIKEEIVIEDEELQEDFTIDFQDKTLKVGDKEVIIKFAEL